MNPDYFPHFIRANYKNTGLTNEEIMEVFPLFDQYLKEKMKDRPATYAKCSDISPLTVVQRMDVPMMVNGYHPALILHFDNFVKERLK